MPLVTASSPPRARGRGRANAPGGPLVRTSLTLVVLVALGASLHGLQLVPKTTSSTVEAHGLVGALIVENLSSATSFAATQLIGMSAAAAAAAVVAHTTTRGWRALGLTLVAVVAIAPVAHDPLVTVGLGLLGPALVGTWRTHVDGRARWWVVGLAWLGALVHPVWMLAPVLGLCLALRPPRGDQPSDAGPRTSTDWLAPLSALAAGALTPLGPVTLAAPFLTVQQSLATLGSQPTHSVREPAVALVLVVLGATWLGWQRSGRATDRALLAGWTLLVVLTLTSSVASSAAALALPLMSGPLLQDRFPPSRRRHARTGVGPRTAIAGMAATLVALALALPAATTDRTRADLFPALGALPAGSVLVTDRGLVDLVDRSGADVALLAGARPTDPPSARERLPEVLAAEAGWDRTLRAAEADSALLQLDSPLAVALEDQWGWAVGPAVDGLVVVSRP